MFTSLFLELMQDCKSAEDRADGAAFLKAALALYGLKNISYLVANMPCQTREGGYFHSYYSERAVRHRKSSTPVDISKLVSLGLTQKPSIEWGDNQRLRIELHLRLGTAGKPLQTLRGVSFPLTSVFSETAVVGFAFDAANESRGRSNDSRLREIEILGNYFHSHILRLNGNNAEEEMLVSAKELDCLKWTAEGKTAWEASIILGISERTVRFHLNSAREKMKCATTTQAVAKAVSRNLIAI